MVLVEIFSKAECHLCDRAIETAKRVQIEHPFDLRLVKLEERDPEFLTFKEKFPVIHINRQFAFQYRIPESEFIQTLESLRA